jgi:hypothetical protein
LVWLVEVVSGAPGGRLGAQEPPGPRAALDQPKSTPVQVGAANVQGADGTERALDKPPQAKVLNQREPAPRRQTERSVPPARLFELKKATLRAEGEFHAARLASALAELAVEEYEDRTFMQDLADLLRAQDRLEWARRMRDKGFIDNAQKFSEELALKKARFALEQVQSKRFVLVDYTKGKTVKELNSALDLARSTELEKQQLWLRAKTTESELQRQSSSDKSR